MIFSSRNKKLIANVQKLEELAKMVALLNQENLELLNVVTEREKIIKKIIDEKSKGFPWLADAIAEFYKYQDDKIAEHLTTKSHPALKSADNVREIAKQNKILRKQLKIAENFVRYYETLFPWINEYVGDDLDELLKSITQTEEETLEESDPVLKYIPRAEYNQLTDAERNQKALDRYFSSRKKPHEIGRDYERYVGFHYERRGFKVEYVGIEKGLEDLGRDLVCIKGDEIEIIQCKCWASHKIIHEKHVNQLYGTVIKYYIDNIKISEKAKSLVLFPELIKSKKIKATLITSTKLSDTAKSFAEALGITVYEMKPLDKYPIIKCNISSNGNKIYHLPFDQQYDKTLIRNDGESYVATIKEAEDKGFRRAFRWKGLAD